MGSVAVEKIFTGGNWGKGEDFLTTDFTDEHGFFDKKMGTKR